MFKVYKKILIFILAFVLLITSNVFADEVEEETDYSIEEILETASSSTEELEILSNCAVAYDRSSKVVLWKKNENKQVPMASTTKIMTAIILLENIKELDEQVKVCKEAANIGGSKLGLKKGDKITINDLLYGLMLHSGNDCAIQIAVNVSGSIESFAQLMNNKAKELGLNNTNFITPHGLDETSHYTTAYELAVIADYALNISKFAEVVNTKTYNVNINGYFKTICNTNELLGYLEGVNGVKTGFTNNAGRCLVTSVNRNEFNIIVVVLGANTKKIRTKDSIKIIKYIYDNYEMVNIKKRIEEEYENWKQINERRIKVNKGIVNCVQTVLEDIKLEKYPTKKENIDNISLETNNIYELEAPINKKNKVGGIKVFINGKEIEEISIEVKEKIGKKKIWDYFKIFAKLKSSIFLF